MRVWIDDNFDVGSYTNPEDETFESGFLTEPHIT